MPTVVIDASAAGAVLFAETRREQVLRAIDGCDLVAPALIRHEIASIALKKARTRPEERSSLRRAVRQYQSLRIVEQDAVAAAVFDLAIDTGLSAYDASCLWLARHLDVPLITLDTELARAAAA